MLFGANAVTGARCSAICSMIDSAGIAVRNIPGRSAATVPLGRSAAACAGPPSRKTHDTCGRRPSKSLTKPDNWSNVRTDKVAGIIGTSRVSTACKTFSDNNEMLGGQSRNTTSYSPSSGSQQLVNPAGRPLHLVKLQVHIAVAEIGRDQVKPVEIGGLDHLVNRSGTVHQRAATAFDFGPHPEQISGGALRVEIPQQCAVSAARGQMSKIDRGRRLANAAL